MLNLPGQVKQGTTVVSAYTYDAGGQKLRRTSTADPATWYYISGVVYTNNAISYVRTEELRLTAAFTAASMARHDRYQIISHDKSKGLFK